MRSSPVGNLVGVVSCSSMTTLSPAQRHPGGTQEVPRRHPEAPRRQSGHQSSL